MIWLLVLVMAKGPSIQIIDMTFETELQCKNTGFAMRAKHPDQVSSYHCKAFPKELFNEPDLG